MQKRFITIAIVLLLILGLGGIVAYNHYRNGRNTLPRQYYESYKNHKQQTTSAASATTPLDHVVIIALENKPQASIIGNPNAPYVNQLAGSNARATNYYAVTNPSLPNYIALTSGTTAGITSDCNPPGGACVANVPNIADSLEQAGKTWKEYAESMPQPCYAGNSGAYAVKHNPFLYYPDILNNGGRCNAHVVPFGGLASDLTSVDTLPSYVFITPNTCNDMHDCSVATGDTWLSQQVPKILGSPAFTLQHSLLVIVWDEGNNSNNNVPVIFAGSAAKQDYITDTYYSHYSLLRTIENNFGLTPLTHNDTSATPMADMLR
jgi:hypothetical protein